MATLEAVLKTDLLVQNLYQEAALRWGPLYRRQEVRARIRRVLPPMPFRVRVAKWYEVRDYSEPIPVEALHKYDEARHAKVFDAFYVVEPAYEMHEVFADPWLIGRVGEQYAVIARW